MLARRAAVALPEALEQVRGDVRRKADRRCRDTVSAHVAASRSSADVDAAAGRRELDRVRQQVPRRPAAADRDRRRSARGVGSSRRSIGDPLGVGGRPQRLDRRLRPAAAPRSAAMCSSSCRRRCARCRAGPRSGATAPSRPARSPARRARSASASSLPLASSRAHPSTELSGVRSSCESVARNSSFRRFASVGLARLFVGRAEQRRVILGHARRCRARSWRATTTPMTTPPPAIASASSDRADVLDFPHQHRRQHANRGKRRDDQPSELRARMARHRQMCLQACGPSSRLEPSRTADVGSSFEAADQYGWAVVRVAALGGSALHEDFTGRVPAAVRHGSPRRPTCWCIAGDLTDYGLPEEAAVLARELTALRIPGGGRARQSRRRVGQSGRGAPDPDRRRA